MAGTSKFFGGFAAGLVAASMAFVAYMVFPSGSSTTSGGITLIISVDASERSALFTITNGGEEDACLFESNLQCFKITPSGRQFATMNPAQADSAIPDVRLLLVVPAGGSVTVPVEFDTYGDPKYTRLDKFQGVITNNRIWGEELAKIKSQLITQTIESSVVLAN